MISASRRLTKFSAGVLVRGFATSVARQRVNKIYPSAAEAVKVVKSGDTILSGGFGLCGLVWLRTLHMMNRG